MNRRLEQQSSYQTRMLTATGIVASLAVAFALCLILIPVQPDKLFLSPTNWCGVQSIHFGNIKVYKDVTGDCGASRNSIFSPTVTVVTDSVPHAQEFGGGKIAGKGGSLSPEAKYLLRGNLLDLMSSSFFLTEPAPDLSSLDYMTFEASDISGGGQIIYLPNALYWQYPDAPPETTVVSGVIIQGAWGLSFVLNSVMPTDPRVRAAVVETFQRYLFIVGKGEVYQPYQGVFIDGQRCSQVSGGKYATGM